MKSHQGFLHSHPQLEKDLGVPKDHVIVDRNEWEKVREVYDFKEPKPRRIDSEVFPNNKPYCGHTNMQGCPLYIECDECDKQPPIRV